MPKNLWRYLRVALVIGAVLLPLTREALRSYPKMDDAGLELLIKENGIHAVTAAQTNRPLVGWIVQKVALTSHLRSYGAILQFAGWALLGLVAYALWVELFPDKKQYAPIAACLTIAPLLLKAQLMTWFFVIPVNLPVILGYGAGLLLWRYVRRGSRAASVYLALGALLAFGGGMLSEYGILAAFAISLLLLTFVFFPEKAVQTRALQSVGALLLGAVAAHFLYAATAEAHPAFQGVSFTPSLSDLIGHAGHYITRFLRAFWFSTVGAYGQAIATTAAQSTGSFFLTPFVYALFVAGVLAFACWSPADSTSTNTSPKQSRILIIALVLAACGALIPAMLFPPLLVGRDLHMEDMSTRYYFTAAPLVAALTLRTLVALTRQRYWLALPLICGFLIGDAVMQFVRVDARNNQIMRAMGPALRPYVEANPDQTVVLVSDFYGRDNEMTEKASASWPTDLSRRLWISWEAREPIILGGKMPSRASACTDITNIDRNLGTIVRRGHVGNLLWLEPLPQGGFRVEPYCLGPHS